jgi:hypothetical protein
MPTRASYRKLDFVDYFKAFAQTPDEWIEAFISHQKCLAVLEAFVTDRVALGRAVQFLSTEMPKFNPVMEKTLRQSARRYLLPKEDPRHIEVSEDVKRKYAELLPDVSTKGTKRDFWSSDRESTRSIHVYGEREKLWGAILSQERTQYVEYWKVANYEEHDALLTNRALLARIDAYNRRLDDMEPWDHLADIERLAASDLPSLEKPLRSLALAHLSRDIRTGVIEIPTDLQPDFPQIYAERGIS